MATKADERSRGQNLEEQLTQAIQAERTAPREGARCLPVLKGLHAPPKAAYLDPQDNVLLAAIQILAEGGRVYAYHDSYVMAVTDQSAAGESLRSLTNGIKVESCADSLLANLFVCRAGEIDYPPPRWFVQQVFHSDLLTDRLPRIRHYATRPVFDRNFVLRSAGWHPDEGILVHSPTIDPVLPGPIDTSRPATERLPRHLRALLGGFCFRSDADLVNALAMLLTGVLANRFVECSKGVFLIDGNQPGLGKSLLTRAVGVILDGHEPSLPPYTPNDEELSKVLCALLRGRHQSIVIIDNAKAAKGGVVSSVTIEANSTAPELCIRILRTSTNHVQPNDLLWALTMNDTRTSPDLVSRGVPVQLAYEGRPEDRQFVGPDPIRYAREHRYAILGELAGLVIAWTQRGRPRGPQSHRCHEWAGVIGGILSANGLPEFLGNALEAAASFNSQLDDVAVLAEVVLKNNGPFVEVAASGETISPVSGDGQKRPASDWQPFFASAGVLTKELAEVRNPKSRGSRIGVFLSPNVGREVAVDIGGRSGRAILRVETKRARSKVYFFEVHWDPADVLATESVGADLPGADRHLPDPESGPRAEPSVVVAPEAVSRPPGAGPTSPSGNNEEW